MGKNIGNGNGNRNSHGIFIDDNDSKDKAFENAFFDTGKIKERISIQYPFGYIPRSEIGKATGNLLHPKTMANRDSARDGQQINGAVKIGGKVCYPVEEVIAYIESVTAPYEELA